ncbi:MAG: aminoglycoside phosphotransferase family protein [Ardenticatenaceae bacterium]|nr:aminoglycoside phosphotransferase family protein [Ardenticatenaceae bacterium]
MQTLLAYLAEQEVTAVWPEARQWQQWHLQRIGGGANNVLYRATSAEADWAVKFTIRDSRRRAWREFNALRALQAAGLPLAPQPLWLDEASYPLPVVVQTWVEGAVTAVPPQTPQEWESLLRHYVTLHKAMPENVAIPLQAATVNFVSAAAAHRFLQQGLACIPPAFRPNSLLIVMDLADRFAAVQPELPPITLSLCRTDPNILNFVRQGDAWLSVDWENSGWGDPCFEIADLLAHPCYLDIDAATRQWIMAWYAEAVGEETAVARIATYYPLMLAWWVVRLTRMLYEIPRGLDQRLVTRPSDWQAQTQAKYERYVALATAALQ